MIIDCHTHIGRNSHINVTVAELLSSMDKAHIDKALVYASHIADCPNDYLLEQINPHTDRLYGVAVADPHGHDSVWLEIEKLKNLFLDKKIVAVKFYTGYEHYYPNDSIVAHYLKILQDIGCPVIFHSGDCLSSVKCSKLKYSHPLGIDEIAVDFPDLKIIIAHVGNPWWKDTAEICYKNKNVYTDISGFVYGKFTGKDKFYFNQMITEFLSISSFDKLLFGTDFPISDQSSYVKVINSSFADFSTKQLSENIKKAFVL